MSNVKGVFERKFLSPVENGPHNGGFWGKNGVKLNFWFCDPKRHIFARNRVFWHILRQHQCGRLGCRWDEEPKKRTNSRINNLMREISHAQKRNPLSDLDEILQDGRYPRRNHVGKFWWRSVKGFMGGKGHILAFPIDFDRRPYNTLALPCECVILNLSLTTSVVPRQWKEACILSIAKISAPRTPAGYRPISITYCYFQNSRTYCRQGVYIHCVSKNVPPLNCL